MARGKVINDNMLGGLNSRANPTGLPVGYYTEVGNTRYVRGAPSRRKGAKRLDIINAAELGTDTDGALLLNPAGGTDNTYVLIPLHDVHILGPQFTLDITFSIEDLGTAPRYILAFNDLATPQPFNLYVGSDGVVTFTFTDEDSNTFSLNSGAYNIGDVVQFRARRNGATLEMVIDNAVVDVRSDLSATAYSVIPTGDLLIGAATTDASAHTGFDGVVDEFRLWKIAVPGHQHSMVEYPHPRHPGLVAHYRFDDSGLETGTPEIVLDDSKYGNHGLIYGTHSYTEPLVVRLNPIIGIHNYQNVRGNRKALIVGGEFYTSDII